MIEISKYIIEKFKLGETVNSEEKYEEIFTIIEDYFSSINKAKYDISYQELGTPNRIAFLIKFDKEYTYKESRDWANALHKAFVQNGYIVNFHIANDDNILINLTNKK